MILHDASAAATRPAPGTLPPHVGDRAHEALRARSAGRRWRPPAESGGARPSTCRRRCSWRRRRRRRRSRGRRRARPPCRAAAGGCGARACRRPCTAAARAAGDAEELVRAELDPPHLVHHRVLVRDLCERARGVAERDRRVAHDHDVRAVDERHVLSVCGEVVEEERGAGLDLGFGELGHGARGGGGVGGRALGVFTSATPVRFSVCRLFTPRQLPFILLLSLSSAAASEKPITPALWPPGPLHGKSARMLRHLQIQAQVHGQTSGKVGAARRPLRQRVITRPAPSTTTDDCSCQGQTLPVGKCVFQGSICAMFNTSDDVAAGKLSYKARNLNQTAAAAAWCNTTNPRWRARRRRRRCSPSARSSRSPAPT